MTLYGSGVTDEVSLSSSVNCAARSGKVILSCEGVSPVPAMRTFGWGNSPVCLRTIGIVVAAVTGGLNGTIRVDLEGRETLSRIVSFLGAFPGL